MKRYGIGVLALTFSLGTALAADQDLQSLQNQVTMGKTPTPAANPNAPLLIPPPPALKAKSYVVMDTLSGMVVAEKEMNTVVEPASLTKLMTLYLTFSALHSGQIHLNDQVPISAHAWKMDGSRMFVKVGSFVTVDELIRGITVASGNDATVALAEYIGGTEETFAQLMNQTAQSLGMKNTHFMDSTGMPNDQHYTTAYDLALLARALIENFPQEYHYFSEKWITYNNIKQPNRNRLLWQDPSVDGLKTGHTDSAGFCLIASAKRNNMRLISVIMNTPNESERAIESEALLNYGFRFYTTKLVFNGMNQLVTPRVWKGAYKKASLGLANNMYVTVPVGTDQQLKTVVQMMQPLKAPLMKGQTYGQVLVELNGKIVGQAPLVALSENPQGGWLRQGFDSIALLFKK